MLWRRTIPFFHYKQRLMPAAVGLGFRSEMPRSYHDSEVALSAQFDGGQHHSTEGYRGPMLGD